jgi:hypothetical protein
LAAASLIGLSTARAQLATPSSDPGTLTAPTASILLNPTDLPALQTWWTTPASGYQTTIKNSVNATANASLSLAAPSTLAQTTTQASIAQAKALRWLLTGNGNTASQDFLDVKNVLTNYAAIGSGSSGITAPLASKGYLVAYDFINAGLTASQRSAILTRLNTNVANKWGSPQNNNNQYFINYGVRGLYALLSGNKTNLNSALSNLHSAYNANTTDDGFMTDGDRYLDYSLGTMAPFLNAYKNASNDATGIAQYQNAAAQQARYALGVRLPNGLSPSFHNSDNTAYVVQELSRMVTDPSLKAATVWYANQLNGFKWNGDSVALNNQSGMTDLLWTVDATATATAPNWSPTYFSGGQGGISVFKNDWGTNSNYLATTAGIDNPNSFAQNDTGAITLAANGTQVLVEPGYARYNGVNFFGWWIGGDSAMPNTPAHSGGTNNLDTTPAIEHNVLLARDHGTTPWGIGNNGDAESNTNTDITVTNRLDSAERGNFKGVADFSTLKADYTGGGAGANVQERRSTAMMNESATDRGYFVMADAFRSTNSTNKDFALNLIGKSTAANTQIMADTAHYKELRWSVNSYLGTYSQTTDPSIPQNYATRYPYNQTADGQVIAHIISSGTMDSVAQDSSWMVENWGVFIQTQRLRVSMSNTSHGAFLTLFETGPANAASQWTVTPITGTDYAAAKVVNTNAGWNDWHLAQTNNTDVHTTGAAALVSIDSGALESDAQYAYLRRTGSGMDLDSAMISRGTTLSSDGQTLFTFSNPVTASFLFSDMADGDLLGTLSMDDYTDNTLLTLGNLPGDITAVTYNGVSLSGFTADSIALPYLAGLQSVSFNIAFGTGLQFRLAAVPEPASATLLLAGAGLLLLTRRRRCA